MQTSQQYIGRFAPTPTGPLHQGSLVAALASYLDAKKNNGKWLLRIEDLDPPREDESASELIPQQLLAHGLNWIGPVGYQSQNSARYEKALLQLKNQMRLFPCTCSRKDLSNQNGLHQGDCHSSPTKPHAWRLPVEDKYYSFEDTVYGNFGHNLKTAVGDQILKRKDGLYAYQLAVVVDDHLDRINHVVRGVDLLDNTPRQLYLMKCLNISPPKYTHLPLILNSDGQKLSKQNQAKALNLQTAPENLVLALGFLNQVQPPEHLSHSCKTIINWAIEHWQPSAIPAHKDGLIL